MFISKGLSIVFEEEFDRRIGGETLLITGSSRGGTSAITYALRRLGYYLGDNCNPRNHADLDFLKTIMGRARLKNAVEADEAAERPGRGSKQSRRGKPIRQEDLKAFRDLVTVRNSQHERWGCKLAPATRMLPALVPNLRNPICLLIYRSAYAIGVSKSRRNKKHDGSSERFLNDIWRNGHQLVRATEHIETLKLPSILMDFSELQTAPLPVLETLSKRLGLAVSDDLLASVARDLSTPGYKEVPNPPGT